MFDGNLFFTAEVGRLKPVRVFSLWSFFFFGGVLKVYKGHMSSVKCNLLYNPQLF